MNARLCLALSLLWLGALPAAAHEMRPAYLEIRELAGQQYAVTWKVPMILATVSRIEPVYPDHCNPVAAPTSYVTESAWITRATLDCSPEGLKGQTLGVEGLSGTMTDVLVRIDWQQGEQLNLLLKPDHPSARLGPGAASGVTGYLRLGVEHLLSGIDHVLFVIGLLFLGQNAWALVRIVTSFTVAHSITLGLSALDVVRVSQRPVEAAIALSILFLAVELAKEDRSSLLYRRPWLIAFIFGLLHGFGFAGALREIGLPQDAVVWALMLFNLGVEVGQLIVVCGCLALAYLIRRLPLRLPPAVARAPVMGIGAVSAYWLIGRTVLLF